MAAILIGLASAIFGQEVMAEPFRFIRIGDKDGFGFQETAKLQRGGYPVGRVGAADANGNGRLDPGEFLPDLSGDGRVAWFSADDFDHRLPAELLDRANFCRGCSAVHEGTKGSNWTDLALSTAAEGKNWPDADGPQTPNNATFIFDFTVKSDDIAAGSPIFFNLVFGDYDVNPAIVFVQFAKEKDRRLEIENHGFERDGLIQARSTVLRFDEVFTADKDGNWHGYVAVVFAAPFEPYTAFDFVELSLFQIASTDPQTGRQYAWAAKRF